MHELTQYLGLQLKDITTDEILELNPEIPEILEILWAAIEYRIENNKKLLDNLKKRELGAIRHIPNIELKSLQDLKQKALKLSPFPERYTIENLRKYKALVEDRKKGLEDWLNSSQYQTTKERRDEVLDSLNYYTRCLSIFKIKAVSNYGYPIPPWETIDNL